MTKGNIEAQADYAMRDPSDLLLGKPDGTFREAAEQAGLMSFDAPAVRRWSTSTPTGCSTWSASTGATNVALWRNVGARQRRAAASMGNWLAVELRQQWEPTSTRIGAWIEVRGGDLDMQRELTVGGGHAGGQLGPIHFGLGSADAAQIRITWPDASVGAWQDVSANHGYTIERDAPAPTMNF